MTDIDKVFAGSIPSIYDHYLGSLIFEPYATDLAQRLAFLPGGELLETAAGTGIVTRALANHLDPGVRIVATDLNQPMLDHAASRLASERVTWSQANALSLPYEDASFDAVVCQFGVMFFPDRPKAYREALRVLKPGGAFLFNVWDKIEENEFACVTTDALKAIFPGDPPLFLARTPHGHHDVGTIERELRVAGFGQIKIETIPHRSRALSAREPAYGYCQGTPLRNEIEARDATRLQEATDAAARAIAVEFGSGPVDGKIQAHVVFAARD